MRSAASAADLKTADEWVDKTMATKKAKAEKAARPTVSPCPASSFCFATSKSLSRREAFLLIRFSRNLFHCGKITSHARIFLPKSCVAGHPKCSSSARKSASLSTSHPD